MRRGSRRALFPSLLSLGLMMGAAVIYSAANISTQLAPVISVDITADTTGHSHITAHSSLADSTTAHNMPSERLQQTMEEERNVRDEVISSPQDHTPHSLSPTFRSLVKVSNDSLHLRQLFPLRPGFSFPQPAVTLPPSEVDNATWMADLRRYLSSLSGRRVNMVTSNIQYQDVLLNWLISAIVRSTLPLRSVLVICMDRPLHILLSYRGIASVYIPTHELLLKEANFTTGFQRVMMLRLAVMRLLNHWGYDAHNYDTDAVLLRDPQPLYDGLGSSDIIGSVGRIPDDLMAEWGITICIGVVIIRSNERTGQEGREHGVCVSVSSVTIRSSWFQSFTFPLCLSFASLCSSFLPSLSQSLPPLPLLPPFLPLPPSEAYWQAMPTVCPSSLDDQEKLNCALKALHITWDNADTDQTTTTVRGRCRNGLEVSILPYCHICRQTNCDPSRRSSYYIWHKGGFRSRRQKLKGSREGNTWFLRYKWYKIDNELQGQEWLSSIAYWEVTHT